MDFSRELYFNVGGPYGPVGHVIYFLMLNFILYSTVMLIIFLRKSPGTGKKRTGFVNPPLLLGFSGLLAVTLLIAIQENIIGPLFHYHFIYGSFYRILSLIGEICGIMLLIGSVITLVRAFMKKLNGPQGLFLISSILLIVIVITGFFLESMRIAITGMPPFEVWSFAGFSLAKIFMIFDIGIPGGMHRYLWWAHLLMVIHLLVLLPIQFIVARIMGR
ncbi:MAG: hypothetical protein GY754_01220 [bacterium]|nr:hypothetical protein [bacterium]